MSTLEELEQESRDWAESLWHIRWALIFIALSCVLSIASIIKLAQGSELLFLLLWGCSIACYLIATRLHKRAEKIVRQYRRRRDDQS